MKLASVGQRQRKLHEQLADLLAEFRDVVAAPPELELDLAEDDAGLREGRLAVFEQPSNVVGMAMGDHHHVDVPLLIAGVVEQRPEPADARAAPQRPVAGIEQHEFAPGVHDGRRIGVLEAGRRQAVGLGVPLHHLGRLVGAEQRVRTVPLADAVEDVGDLEGAQSEAADRRPQNPFHRARHGTSLRLMCVAW